MTPFKDRIVKWKKGDNCCGRYKNVNGIKFDIIKQSPVVQSEPMPKCFLADTPEEAEALYKKYADLLNGLAYSYAISTGLQKVDLFGEALIGLGRAYRDWNPNRSDNFKVYALYRIKDALNEFARDNVTSVTVPAYIKKSHSHVVELKEIFNKNNIVVDGTLLSGVVKNITYKADRDRSVYLINKIINAADRAKTPHNKFVKRIEHIPQDCTFEDLSCSYEYEDEIETALVVEKLKTYMDSTELLICQDIMGGVSYEEIGKKFGKHKVWVRRKLDKLSSKILASWS